MPADFKLRECLLFLSDCRKIDQSKLVSHGVECLLSLVNLGFNLFLLLFRLLCVLLCFRLRDVCAYFEFLLVSGQTLLLFHHLPEIAADGLLHLVRVCVCPLVIQLVFATYHRL